MRVYFKTCICSIQHSLLVKILLVSDVASISDQGVFNCTKYFAEVRTKKESSLANFPPFHHKNTFNQQPCLILNTLC